MLARLAAWSVLGIVALASCGGSKRDPEPIAGERTTGDELEDADDPADPRAPTRAPVACGAATCGPDQYCEVRCTCCGMRIPDPSEASADLTCRPLDARCSDPTAASDPDCTQRTVHIPCA